MKPPALQYLALRARGERTTWIAAQRPMKPPALQYLVVLRARRADDMNCCTATDEVARSAVLSVARERRADDMNCCTATDEAVRTAILSAARRRVALHQGVHPRDCHKSDRNILVKSNNTWLTILTNVPLFVFHVTTKRRRSDFVIQEINTNCVILRLFLGMDSCELAVIQHHYNRHSGSLRLAVTVIIVTLQWIVGSVSNTLLSVWLATPSSCHCSCCWLHCMSCTTIWNVLVLCSLSIAFQF